MRVLLTRAEQDASRTREKLEALGFEAIGCPVIEVVGTGVAWPPGVVDAALATSGHAFNSRMDGPTLEARRLMPLLLVGTRTQEAARTHGFLGPATTAKNAAALAAEIARSGTGAKRIVYLAGRERKPDIEAALEGVNHELDIIETYEARPIETPSTEAARALRHRNIDVILHFSQRSAALLLQMASAHGLDIRSPAHLCLSEDVALPLRAADLTEVYAAAFPSESSLLELLAEAAEEPERE